MGYAVRRSQRGTCVKTRSRLAINKIMKNKNGEQKQGLADLVVLAERQENQIGPLGRTGSSPRLSDIPRRVTRARVLHAVHSLPTKATKKTKKDSSRTQDRDHLPRLMRRSSKHGNLARGFVICLSCRRAARPEADRFLGTGTNQSTKRAFCPEVTSSAHFARWGPPRVLGPRMRKNGSGRMAAWGGPGGGGLALYKHHTAGESTAVAARSLRGHGILILYCCRETT